MSFSVDNLVDALMLVLHSTRPDTKKLIDEVIEVYDNERKNSIDLPDNIYGLYISLLRTINAQDLRVNDSIGMSTFILSLKTRPELLNDADTYITIKNILQDTTAMSDDQQLSLSRKLANAVVSNKNTHIVNQLRTSIIKLRSGKLSADYQSTIMDNVNDLCNQIVKNNKEVADRFAPKSDSSTVSFLDFSNKDNIKSALNAYKVSRVTNVLKTGWQALNRALGGGLALGSSLVFNALAYSGKTMMLLKMLRWIVTLNDPPKQFSNPTVILYSLENETPQNLKLLFNELYFNKHREAPPTDWDIDKMADFCYDECTARGWRLIIDRRLGREFGAEDLMENFESYVQAGYTPLAVVIDYMNIMRKGNGKDNARPDLLVRELYTDIRNFLTSRNCIMITAHQLNRKASEAARINPTNAVKRFNMDMLADSTDPQREVDLVIYQHKEKALNGEYWMTFKLDKDRYNLNTPEEHKFFAMKFQSYGILDDINGEDMSSTNINATKEDESIGDMMITPANMLSA